MLVAWELLEDCQFPPVTPDLPEVAKFASLWAMKDPQRFKDSKTFWILMEMSIHMPINRKSHISPTVYENLKDYVDFKDDFHWVSICVRKDPEWKWYDLP